MKAGGAFCIQRRKASSGIRRLPARKRGRTINVVELRPRMRAGIKPAPYHKSFPGTVGAGLSPPWSSCETLTQKS